MDGQRDPNKRMRYFDGQLLRADDFLQEQFYHVQRRQLHHRLVYALPGVVGAGGLEVVGASNDASVMVKRGTAINTRGEELVLTADSLPIPLPSAPVTKAEVYIVYASTDTDGPDPSAQATHTIENPTFIVRKTAPASSAPTIPEAIPDRGVLLAELTLANGKLAQAPNNAVRSRVGFNLGDSTVLRLGAANTVDLTGSLRVAGNVGIGTSAPVSKLQVKTLTAIDEGPTAAGAWANFGSNAYLDGGWKRIDPTKAGANLHVNADGEGQEFRFLRVEADGTRPRNLAVIGSTLSFINEGNVGIGTQTPSGRVHIVGGADQAGTLHLAPDPSKGPNRSHVHWAATGDWYIRSAASTGMVVIQDTGGNVGVGTSSPSRKLHVEGSEIHSGGPAGGLSFGNREAGAFVENPAAGERWVWYASKGTGRAQVAAARLWSGSDKLSVTAAGNVGIGTATPSSKLTVEGSIAGRETTTGWVLGKGAYAPDNWLRLTTTQGGSNYHDLAVNGFWASGVKRFDLAEITPADADDDLQPGDVVVIDNEDGLRVTRSTVPRDTSVYGITSSYEQASMIIGGFGGPEGVVNARDKVPVALIGRVKAKACAENGAIKVGDLLTTSSRPGHLMRCEDPSKSAGAIAGKALESLPSGEGMIMVLVTLQ